jgi:hypothetical protein
MDAIHKLASMLRTTPDIIAQMDEKMSVISHKKNVLNDLVSLNDKLVDDAIWALELKHPPTAESVHESLITKLKASDAVVFNLFKQPTGTSREGLSTVCNIAYELANPPEGWFLKRAKAVEILEKSKPPNIMKALGYATVKEMLEKESLFEVFAALRFVESTEWMHSIFDSIYRTITPLDFEQRKIELEVLNEKWLTIAEKFVKKKYHNISHLKELGVIFVIPLKIDTPGETMRLFSLILHYLHEVSFYSKLFEFYADRNDFSDRLVSLLRGDVLEAPMMGATKMHWLIIQRYLAKDNEKDHRLFVPHVNPEAVHWRRAEEDINRLSKRFGSTELGFWASLDWVGDHFTSRQDGQALVSLDLVDNVMALIKEKEMIKYLYHQQEALWNKIFTSYFDEETMDKYLIQYFDKGYFTFEVAKGSHLELLK